MEEKLCLSCGTPLKTPEDHGGNDPNNHYCHNCTNEIGILRPRHEVKNWIVDCYLQLGIAEYEVEDEAEQYMRSMPAWREEQN